MWDIFFGIRIKVKEEDKLKDHIPLDYVIDHGCLMRFYGAFYGSRCRVSFVSHKKNSCDLFNEIYHQNNINRLILISFTVLFNSYI